jgi:hypothetical protein
MMMTNNILLLETQKMIASMMNSMRKVMPIWERAKNTKGPDKQEREQKMT